jgi:GT2 family glycosyltransferase
VPLLDVVIVNYNAGPWLGRVVAALHAQTFRDFRTIIVDNGSTDGSLDGLPSGPTSVEVVRAATNLGFAKANNLAIRGYVTAEWVVLLNPDAFPRPDWLERFLGAARANPKYTFFGCRMLDANDPTRLDGVGDIYHVSGQHWREGYGCPASGTFLDAREIFAPCGAAAMYRTDVLIAAGGFDEDYFCYSEDVDLGFRLRLAGHRCLYVPDAVVHHVGSGIAGVESDFQLRYLQRNLVWTFVKNMPGKLFWLYLPYHFVLNSYIVFLYSRRGRGRAIMRAKFEALRGLPAILRKRRALQNARKASAADLLRMMRRGSLDSTCPDGSLPATRVQPRLE